MIIKTLSIFTKRSTNGKLIKTKLRQLTLAKKILLMIISSLLTSQASLAIAETNNAANTTTSSDNHIKVATFNVSMDATNYLARGEIGKGDELINALSSDHNQIKNIAEIIQHVRPDILLLNEFDYIKNPSQGIEKFIKNYLNKSQQNAKAIDYPYYYYAPVNTGVPTDFDLDNNGKKQGNMADSYGFGHFPGHFGMVLLSRFPIDEKNIRTFQYFLWHDMPNAIKPKDPKTGVNWYSNEAWQALRLSSKSHWDIPVKVNGETLHILASHPTPPVFDGPENRNGARNHDEIRFWHDYITPTNSGYIYDDNGKHGGIASHSRFVVLGDQNASPDEGGAMKSGIANLLNSPLINNDVAPSSMGGKKNSDSEFAKNHTAGWKMRADYVLPSRSGISIKQAGIFWPEKQSPLYRLIETRASSSDHRMVWLDVKITKLNSEHF